MAKLVFDGIDLTGSDYNVTALSATRSSGAPRDMRTQAIPRGEGVAWDMGRTPRTISVEVAQWGDTPEQFRQRHDRLMRLLNAAEPKSLRLDWAYPDRYWLVWLANDTPVSAFRQSRFERFRLEFVAPDPYALSVDEVTAQLSVDSDPFDFDLAGGASPAAPVGGSADARPVYVITNDDAESPSQNPITFVALENTTTGDKLTWDGILLEAEQLRIDTDRMLVEFSADGGATWAAAMAELGDAVAFPRVRPGVVNEMRLTGVHDGTLDISYRHRFI